MQTVNRLQLAEALRSGKWEPGKRTLGRGKKERCCLGVACELALGRPLTNEEKTHGMPSDIGVQVLDEDNIYHYRYRHLARLNDGVGWEAVLMVLDDPKLYNQAGKQRHTYSCGFCEKIEKRYSREHGPVPIHP